MTGYRSGSPEARVADLSSLVHSREDAPMILESLADLRVRTHFAVVLRFSS